MKRYLITALTLLAILMAGCGAGDEEKASVEAWLEEYKRASTVSYFDVKNLKDDGTLSLQVDDYLNRLRESSTLLAQMSGSIDKIKDEGLRNELKTFIESASAREATTIKYLEDIKQDINLKEKNFDMQVDVNRYILRLPQDLREMEFKVNESIQKLDVLLTEDKKAAAKK